MKTSTSADDEDEIFKQQKTIGLNDPLNLNKILNFEILPSLLEIYCLTHD